MQHPFAGPDDRPQLEGREAGLLADFADLSGTGTFATYLPGTGPGSIGRDIKTVEELNTLLEVHPVQPRISGHDAGDWHMHVTSRAANGGAEYLAGAVWGLAVWLCEYGSSRFGVCADDRCGNVYLDTSSNCCRRFCSERCATRSHVAAHRARKRAAGDDRNTAEATPQQENLASVS